MKKRYIDVMEHALEAYRIDQIDDYFEEVQRDGLTEHGFARLTVNIGTMLAHGRKQELYDRFVKMMSFCCEHVSTDCAANDFSIQEMLVCIDLLEENGTIATEIIENWRENLKKPVIYTEVAKSADQLAYNWVLFSATSEFLRMKRGLCPMDMDFIDMQLATQVVHFDENCMYRDAAIHAPIVYDNVPRTLFSILMYYGYNGKYRDMIDRCLRHAGLLSLKMQSSTGEAPCTGRSNQFYHNDAQLAAVLEYEAVRYKKEGNEELARRFKKAASDALASIKRGLSNEPIHHVKNRFPLESKYGCDHYGYFNKYMITAASFLNWARIFCDENIEPADNPLTKPDVLKLSDDFHLMFLRAGDYSAQIDLDANPDLDSSGVCRIHRRGAPSDICLSCSGTGTPIYTVDREDCCDISFAAGRIRNGEALFKTRGKYDIVSYCSNENTAQTALSCELDGEKLDFTVNISESGADITVRGNGNVALMLPVLDFNGEVGTSVTQTESTVEIDYLGHTCKYTSNGKIYNTGRIGCNRNGHYKIFYAEAVGEVKAHISIETT